MRNATRTLPERLKTSLNFTRRIRLAGDDAEGVWGKASVRSAESRVIREIQRIRAEPYLEALGGAELFADANVPVGGLIDAEVGRARTHVADGERIGLAERGRVEPFVEAVLSGAFDPSAESLRVRVRRLVEAAADVVGRDAECRAALVGGDAVDHPSAERHVDDFRNGIAEAPAHSERKLVHVVEYEAMRDVEIGDGAAEADGVAVLESALAVVDALGPGVRPLELQAAAETFLQRDLKRVVGGGRAARE